MAQRTWFITGVSSGFGLRMTEQLLERGDRVVGTVLKAGQNAQLAGRYGDSYRACACREPCPRLRSLPHSPARRFPATSRAAGAGPMPGSRQRQARSSSVSAVAAICCHGQATRPYTAVILHPGPNRRAADADHLPALQAQRAAALRRNLAHRVPAGTGASALWFRAVPGKAGLRLRFAPA